MASTKYLSQNSKKREFVVLDLDADEISSPISRTPKIPGKKEPIVHEVIDLDEDEDLQRMLAVHNANRKRKGKGLKDSFDASGNTQGKISADLSSHAFEIKISDGFGKGGSDKEIKVLSNFLLDDDSAILSNNSMDVDDKKTHSWYHPPKEIGTSPSFVSSIPTKSSMKAARVSRLSKPASMNSKHVQEIKYDPIISIVKGSGFKLPSSNSLFNSNSHTPQNYAQFSPQVVYPSYQQWGLGSQMNNFISPSLGKYFGSTNTALEDATSNIGVLDGSDIRRKFKDFKQFDTVEDYSDHHYIATKSNQPPKTWAKKIQEEWRILEKDLPDMVFVRVYEARMDLMRAVIIGAEGTPYHDGLFFFDILFPSEYPKKPPLVHYHSGGLRLNPNLYHCGKVCLSLLNTWTGRHKTEKWVPGQSTMLQVLVSIQALILNQKPFFNEPGYERMSGSEAGKQQSETYNENTFILSLKTMVYSMRRPPKNFEDYVRGHFHARARDILVACEAYMHGAQVGCLVKGGVQDVDEGDKSCSKNFKDSLPSHIDMLIGEFIKLGVNNLEKFQNPAKK